MYVRRMGHAPTLLFARADHRLGRCCCEEYTNAASPRSGAGGRCGSVSIMSALESRRDISYTAVNR